MTCIDSYYLNTETQVCIKCPYPCLTCSSDITCLTCLDPDTRKTSPHCNCLDDLRETGNGCINCVNGYYSSDSKCSYCKIIDESKNFIELTDGE